MKAELLLKERLIQSDNSFVELIVWRIPVSLAGSQHIFQYRLAFVVKGVCVLRYDNEAGKGDHKHIEGAEYPYSFTIPQQLLADFWHDVDHWRTNHE